MANLGVQCSVFECFSIVEGKILFVPIISTNSCDTLGAFCIYEKIMDDNTHAVYFNLLIKLLIAARYAQRKVLKSVNVYPSPPPLFFF